MTATTDSLVWRRPTYNAFRYTGTIFRELEWKTPIFSGRVHLKLEPYRRPARMGLLLCVDERHHLHLSGPARGVGFDRIVVSNTEAPNMFVNLVQSRLAIVQSDNATEPYRGGQAPVAFSANNRSCMAPFSGRARCITSQNKTAVSGPGS